MPHVFIMEYAKMSLFKQIHDLVHQAVFEKQMKSYHEISKFVRYKTNVRSVDPKEIERITLDVCTPYIVKEKKRA